MDRPPPSFRAAIDRTLRLSHYVARVASARPQVVEELERRGAQPFDRAAMRAELAPGDPAHGENLAPRLRR
ncbi:MAG: hypothetical protein ACXWG8_05870, partial [Usitatibacter sp.]